MKKKPKSRKALVKKLQKVREQLNLSLVMADIREFKLQEYGKIMELFDQLLEIFSDFEITYFADSVRFINELLGEVATESISTYTGMSYVLNIYEMLEDAVDSYVMGDDVFDDFDKALQRLRKMVSQAEGLSLEDQPKTENNITQELPPPDILEDDFISEFFSEAGESLELIENSTMELEKNPDNSELIDTIFRIMHTIKGTASFLGMPVIAKIAHQTEDILGEIRDGKRQLNKESFDFCFASIDALNNLIAQLKGLVEGVEVEPVNLEKFYGGLADLSGEQAQELEKSSPMSQTTANKAIPLGDPATTQKLAADKTEIPLKAELKQNGAPPASTENLNLTPGNQSKKLKVIEMLRVPAEKLDELSNFIGEMVVALSLLSQNKELESISDRQIQNQLDHLGKITESLRSKVLELRMFPIKNLFSKLTRQVRDLSQKSNKNINLEISGEDTLVDKSIIENIEAPLIHLVRNSIDHGIEPEEERQATGKPMAGQVSIKAQHKGDTIEVSVKDDGKGLDRDLILEKAIEKGLTKGGENLSDDQVFSFIFHPGFSTAIKVTDISGRGVGLDVVRKTVENLRGKLEIESQPGEGTTFVMNLPLTTSIIEGLVVSVGASRFILPILDVHQIVSVSKDELKGMQGYENQFFHLADSLIPIVPLFQIYGITPKTKDPTKAVIIIVSLGHKKYGIMADELLHRQQIVIQKLGERFTDLQGISGGTILGDGRIGLIIDAIALLQHSHYIKQVS